MHLTKKSTCGREGFGLLADTQTRYAVTSKFTHNRDVTCPPLPSSPMAAPTCILTRFCYSSTVCTQRPHFKSGTAFLSKNLHHGTQLFYSKDSLY